MRLLVCTSMAWGLSFGASHAASFPGNACVEIADPAGGLSWNNAPGAQALTVSCWFKFAIPSGTNIAQHMTVLADRISGNETVDPFAYLIRYNIWNGNLEFVTRGTTSYTNTLIERPYLERWYHVAVVRQGDDFTGYLDGREAFSGSRSVGNSSNNNGVCIGAWGRTNCFWGEIQEVSIYQTALSAEFITEYMFKDQPAIPELVGYYRLAWSADSSDYYRNFSPNPPTNTTFGVKQGSGQIVFEEVNKGGEQSLFDSRKNGGSGAITPLAGAFAWQQTAFSRPTPGIGLSIQYGYSSGNAYGGFLLGSYDPYGAASLGKGWRHTFDARVIPGQYFSPVGGLDVLGVMMWDGSIETWNLNMTNGQYQTRHNEYRGELSLETLTCTWTTPDRLIYRFRHPFLGNTIMRGRLMEIRDFNSNAVHVLWNETIGLVTQVVDTVGGRYDFRYNADYLLTDISFQGWAVNFNYDTTNQLTAKWFTGPPAHANINTRWAFQYNTNGLLATIIDPMSNQAVRVAYDKYGRVTNVTDALNRSSRTEYTVSGTRQIRRTDPAGYKWIETYDRKGRVVSKTDPLTNTVTYTYDEAGNVLSVTEPLGWKTTFAYDERSNRIAQTNELGQVSRWVYHSFFNKPVQVINPLGWSTYVEYNSAGNVVSNWDGLGLLASYTYLSNGLVQTASDALGRTTRFQYNSDRFLVARTDPATNTWTYEKNELGWTMSTTNPLDQVTSFAFNLNGNVIQTIDPLYRIFTSTYNPNGNLVSKIDAKGQITRFYYDAANQQTQTVDRAGAVWRTIYTTRGQVNSVLNPFGNAVSNTYDSVGRIVRVTDPLGSYISTEYDANGNVTATIDKLGRRWTKTYDRLNRVIRSTDPLGNTTLTTYDAAGRVASVASPKGYVSVNTYDGRGRLTKWKDAGGFDWLYDYDAVANITNITDALNGRYVMTYGPRNERLTEKNQDGKIWTYRYDSLLRLFQYADPNGLVKDMTYDAAGRLTAVDYNTMRYDEYWYDDNDNPETITRSDFGKPATFTTLTYDSMDRAIQYKDTFNKSVNYGLDLMGRITNMVYPGGFSVRQQFDALSRLIQQTDSSGRQMNYSYDKTDRLASRRYPNNITQTNTYDTAGRLTNLEYRAAGATNPLIALAYAYDRNGNRSASDEQGTLKWTMPAMMDRTARYTSSGRLIDSADAFNASNNTAFAYDPSGNMTNSVSPAQNYRFTYDEDNRVITVAFNSATNSHTILNRYDSLGRRISRTLDGVETRYVLDLGGGMEKILCDTTSGGTIAAWYVHGPGGLAYKVDAAANLTCYHADGGANIIALTDASTNALAWYAYTGYGHLLPGSTMDGNPYRYVGALGVMGELPGVLFMRARYYSLDTSKFVSVDSVRNVGPGGRSLFYNYARGNPVRFGDASGLTPAPWVNTGSACVPYKPPLPHGVMNFTDSGAWNRSIYGGGGHNGGRGKAAEVTPPVPILPQIPSQIQLTRNGLVCADPYATANNYKFWSAPVSDDNPLDIRVAEVGTRTSDSTAPRVLAFESLGTCGAKMTACNLYVYEKPTGPTMRAYTDEEYWRGVFATCGGGQCAEVGDLVDPDQNNFYTAANIRASEEDYGGAAILRYIGLLNEM